MILISKELMVSCESWGMRTHKFNTYRKEVLVCHKKNQDKGAQGFRMIQSLISLISKREQTIMAVPLGCVQVWVRSFL